MSLPSHFILATDRILLHLASANPVFDVISPGCPVLFSVVDDYAYVPTTWRNRTDPPMGVPTSYYGAIQFRCRATVVDDASEKAALLAMQLAAFQPAGDYVEPSATGAHAALLGAIRGLSLQIVDVTAKFKVDDHKPEAFRIAINDALRSRGEGRDVAAADLQRARM